MQFYVKCDKIITETSKHFFSEKGGCQMLRFISSIITGGFDLMVLILGIIMLKEEFKKSMPANERRGKIAAILLIMFFAIVIGNFIIRKFALIAVIVIAVMVYQAVKKLKN